MALSYSVGDVFLGNGRQGSLEKSAETGGFDDVVITDKHFLDVLNVDSKYLKKISHQGPPPAVKKKLTSYSKTWLKLDSRQSFADKSHVWEGQYRFPSLTAQGLTGKMSDARNPLVVVLDDTVGELAEDTLLSALTSYNLLFTDEALVMDEIQASGIRNAVFSMNTVADQALIEAQNFWDIARVNIVTVAVSCMVIIMCAIQSVRIWSAQNKKMIFLLRSRGESYVGILQRRLLSELMLVLLIAIAVYFYLPMWQTIEHGLLISVIAVFVYLAIEFFASLTQTHSTFTKMVLRR